VLGSRGASLRNQDRQNISKRRKRNSATEAFCSASFRLYLGQPSFNRPLPHRSREYFLKKIPLARSYGISKTWRAVKGPRIREAFGVQWRGYWGTDD
jgi:hypothetical protein